MTLQGRRLELVLAAAAALVCVIAGYAAAERQSLSLLLLAGLAGLALVIVFQEIGFGALVAWVVLSGLAFPFLSTGATGAQVSFDRLLIAGMATWLVLRPSAGRWSPAAKRLGIALAVFAAFYGARAATTSTYGVFAQTSGDARAGAMNVWIDAILLPTALYLIVARFADTLPRVRRLAGGMALAGAALGLLGLAEKLGGFELASRSGGSARVDTVVGAVRISGPFNVPEVYAVVLLVCLAVTLWWTLERRAYGVGTIAISLELAGIALTLFRAAWIGAIFILIAGLGLRPGRVMRVLAVTAVIGLTLALAFTQLESNRVFAARVQNTQNINGRFAVYEQSLEVFRRDPITGVGVNQFVNAQASVPQTVVGGVTSVTSPHSSFLGLLAEQGIVGLLPFLVVVLGAWRLLVALRRRATEQADVVLWACLVGACLAYLVMSLTLSMLPYGPSNAYFAVALGLGAARLNALRRV